MRVSILGAGLMSRAAAVAYLAEGDVEQVVVADVDRAVLDVLAASLPDDPRLAFEQLDAGDRTALERLLRRVDGVLCAMHYERNVDCTHAAIATGSHLVDLGGNNDVVRAQRALDERAREAGVCVTPDCGLAPGLASILVAWGMARYRTLDAVRIRVGGLPARPRGPFEYERLFSVDGLINEYVEPPVVVRDHVLRRAEPLGALEECEFDEPIGVLEAFNTSGGLSTLGETYRDRVRDMDYKTLRHRGHAHAMRWLLGLGLLDREPVEHDGRRLVPRELLRELLERRVPLCHEDRTVVRVEFVGDTVAGGRHVLELVEQHDPGSGLSGMARLTSWPAVLVSLMQCRGEVPAGVVPQERSIDPDRFLERLVARGVTIHGLTPAPNRA